MQFLFYSGEKKQALWLLIPAVLMVFVLSSMGARAQTNESRAPMHIHLPPTLSFCPNVEFPLFTDSIVGGSAPYHFRWHANNELIASLDTVVLNLSDTLLVTLLVIDSNGKMDRDTLTLLPYAPIDAGFATNRWEGCSPVEVTFTSNYVAFQHVASMTWNFGNGDQAAQLASAMYAYDGEGFFFPSLSITDLHGCVWTDTLVTGLRIFPTPNARFQVAEERLYLPETSVVIENNSTGADNFIWQYSQGLPIEGAEPQIELPQHQEGSYLLRLTARNAYGCSHTFSKSLEVVQAIDLYIPNAFTPNGDGINDDWKVEGLGIDAFHLKLEVFDVWGTIVFASEDPEEHWDGYSKATGIPVASGNYNYRILARDTERGIGHLFEGHMILLR